MTNVHGVVLAYVFDQPDEMETGGMYFPLAINNLCEFLVISLSKRLTTHPSVVGLYIEQVCLVCLFALKIPYASNKAIFIAEAAIMVALIVLTFAAQTFIRNIFERASRLYLLILTIGPHET
jgi:calcium permeable stress-gated cation channel